MIVGFEEWTQPLSDNEKALMEIIMEGLKKFSKAKPINNAMICTLINKKYGKKYGQLSEPRVRKIVNRIRGDGLLPVIGSRKGYYVSYDEGDITEELRGLSQRVASIQFSQKGLRTFLKPKKTEPPQTEITFEPKWK